MQYECPISWPTRCLSDVGCGEPQVILAIISRKTKQLTVQPLLIFSQHDYLEAVTSAYMMSGVLVTESKGKEAIFVGHRHFIEATHHQPVYSPQSPNSWGKDSRSPRGESGCSQTTHHQSQFDLYHLAICTRGFPLIDAHQLFGTYAFLFKVTSLFWIAVALSDIPSFIQLVPS